MGAAADAEARLDGDPERTSRAVPMMSVVVPSYGRPGQLRACLGALTALNYPRERFEVVVVDDGSPEPLAGVGAEFEGVMSLRVCVQANGGPASARNRGVREARGEFVAFTDDDCRPRAGWLGALAGAFAEAPGAMLGGRTVNGVAGDVYAEASQSLAAYLYRGYEADPAGATFFATNNAAVPRGAFLEAGGFDTGFRRAAGEDREFCIRWRGQGRAMRYVPGAVVDHLHAMSLRKFWRQHFNYGHGAARLRSTAVEEKMGGRAGYGSAGFYAGLVLHPLGRPEMRARVRQTALLALSQVATAAGMVSARLERGGAGGGLANGRRV